MTGTTRERQRRDRSEQHVLRSRFRPLTNRCAEKTTKTKREVIFALSRRREQPDLEKDQLRREIATLNAALNQLLKHVQNQARQGPSTSVLGEMLVSLQAKPDGVRPTDASEFSQAFVDAFLED